MCSQRRHRLHLAACQNPLKGSQVESPDHNVDEVDDHHDDDHDDDDDYGEDVLHSRLHVRPRWRETGWSPDHDVDDHDDDHGGDDVDDDHQIDDSEDGENGEDFCRKVGWNQLSGQKIITERCIIIIIIARNVCIKCILKIPARPREGNYLFLSIVLF